MNKERFVSLPSDFSNVNTPIEQLNKAKKIIEKYNNTKEPQNKLNTLVSINQARKIIK